MSERFVLALDTCFGPVGAALATAKGELVGVRGTANQAGRQAETLPGVVDELFRSAGVSYQQLGRIIVTVGPGAFTGVRVGLAFAKGLKIATAAEVLGISSLECLAYQYQEIAGATGVATVLDARRGEVYAFAVDARGMRVVAPCMVPAADVSGMLGRSMNSEFAVVGSGRDFVTLDVATKPQPNIVGVDVSRIAVRASSLSAQNYPATPLYLREPDARLPG